MGQFRPTMMHRIWALPDEVRNSYDLSSLQIVFHMAAPMPPWLKEEWIEWLGPEKIYELYGGTERQGACVSLASNGWRQGLGRQDRRKRALEDHWRGRQRCCARGERRDLLFANEGAGSTYHYLGAEPKRRPTAGNRSAILAGSDAEGYLYLGDRLADMILRAAPTSIRPRSKPPSWRIRKSVPASPSLARSGIRTTRPRHLELNRGTMPNRSSTAWAASADQLSRYKHPESFESSTSARATMPARSAARCCATSRGVAEEGRAFRIMPSYMAAKRSSG